MEPHRRAAQNNHSLWFVTLSAHTDSYDINELDPSLADSVDRFMNQECRRCFCVNERGEQEHMLHLHLVADLSETACEAWVKWRMRQCYSASGVSLCVKKIHGGALGSFEGMLHHKR